METRSRKSCRSPTARTSSFLIALLAATFAASVARATPAAVGAPDDAAAIVGAGDDFQIPSGVDLYLDVTVNGGSTRFAHFSEHGGELWTSASTLRRLNLIVPATTPDLVRVGGIPGVQAVYDKAHQSVSIVAPLEMLTLPRTVVSMAEETEPKAATANGVLLNYSVYASQATGNFRQLSAFTEVRAFSHFGVLSSTALAQAAGEGGALHDRSARLDTSWTSSFPASLITVTVGDTLTAASSWSRPDRIAGVQIGTNFALQPYRVTTPLPQFFGSATLPSQVELYVNGMKLYSGGVPAGQFQLNTVPNTSSGSGQAHLVLTDVLGRITTLNYSLYNTPQLLRRGLVDWSAEVGTVRKNYGFRSFDYEKQPVASGTWRYGLTNNVTIETHGETSRSLVAAGVGATWLVGNLGVVSGSAAHSTSRGRSGSQFSFGYTWVNSRFSIAANATRATSGYSDVAALYGAPVPSLTASAQVGYSLKHLGNFGASYVDLRYPGQPASRYVSAFWFASLGRNMSLNVSANQDIGRAHTRSIFATLNILFRHGITATASVQNTADRRAYVVEATQSLPTEGGFGWRAQVQAAGNRASGRGEIDYLGKSGQLLAGASVLGSNYSAYAGATGSVVLMNGSMFAARQITNGFAVVSTDGVAGVPVMLQNSLVGVTGRSGKLLVTNLNAYQRNKLSIDPLRLAADLQIDAVEAVATPADRTGTITRFGITKIRAVLVTLVDATGAPLPVGSRVRLNGKGGEPTLVGFDGVVYLGNVAAQNSLTVYNNSGVCYANFTYIKKNDGIPSIGPLKCLKDYIATAALQ